MTLTTKDFRSRTYIQLNRREGTQKLQLNKMDETKAETVWWGKKA
jgi:ribosomal protein L33